MDAASSTQALAVLRRVGVGHTRDTLPHALASHGLQVRTRLEARTDFVDATGQEYNARWDDDGTLLFIEAMLLIEFDTEELFFDGLYEQAMADFEAAYRQEASRLQSELGAGQEHACEMPHDRDAVVLTRWRLADADFLLELQHQDKELPICLLALLLPAR